jgi:hypothetical protein
MQKNRRLSPETRREYDCSGMSVQSRSKSFLSGKLAMEISEMIECKRA